MSEMDGRPPTTPTKNTSATPIERVDPLVPVDRRDQWCKCGTCGVVSICRPDFDFYTSEKNPGWLECHPCLLVRYAGEGYAGFIDETQGPKVH